MNRLMSQIAIILLVYSNIALSEDVVVSIEGHHYGNIISLDSIFIENLTNQSSLWITNLQDNYSHEFNLTKGSLTGIELPSRNEENLSVLQNTPGILKYGLKEKSPSKIYVCIYNLFSQKIYQCTRNTHTGYNQLNISIGSSEIFIVQLIHNGHSKSIKAYGNPTYNTKVSVFPTNQTENKSELLLKSGNFSFSLNDEIQITGYIKNFKSQPVKKIISESQKLVCDFIDSDTCGLYVDTRDSSAYKWVKIGEQVWMAENLHFKQDSGFKMPEDPELAKIYGGYYNWETAKSSCPDGWHLPTDQEWEQLAEFINKTKGPFQKNSNGWYNIGEFLKAKNGWDAEKNGNDEFMFAALPGGNTSDNVNTFNMMGEMALWWSTTDTTENNAFSRVVDGSSFFRRAQTGKLNYINVRCVRDKVEASLLTQKINKFIYDVINDIYLWNNQLPEIDLKYENDPKVYFQKMLVTNDKTSEITDDIDKLKQNIQGKTRTMGYSLALGKSETNNQFYAVVEYTYPNSPASIAGLKRGSIISKLNSEPINNNNFQQLLSNDSLHITTATISGDNIIDESEIQLFTEDLELNPVLVQKEFEINEHKVGYLLYTNFLPSAKEKLDVAFDSFSEHEITELIVDLRYNKGGEISALQHFCSSIAPVEAVNNEETLATLNWNNQYQHYWEENNIQNMLKITFETSVNTKLNLSKVYFLTSKKTASASEISISGLSSYMDVITIGDTTYGKNLATILAEPALYYKNEDYYKDFKNWGIKLVVLKYGDKNGESLFENGLNPHYYVTDNPLSGYALGDKNESLLKKALEEISGTTIAPTKNAEYKVKMKFIDFPNLKEQDCEFILPFKDFIKDCSIKL